MLFDHLITFSHGSTACVLNSRSTPLLSEFQKAARTAFAPGRVLETLESQSQGIQPTYIKHRFSSEVAS
jgi:hypothetical protein